jgi:ATP-dependent Clp protease ATP-binding subunit ClpC
MISGADFHGPGQKKTHGSFSFDHFTDDVRNMLNDAQEEAKTLDADTIGTDHLLLAATRGGSTLAPALEGAGVTRKALMTYMKERKGTRRSEGSLLYHPKTLHDNDPLPYGKCAEFVLKEIHRAVRGVARPQIALGKEETIDYLDLISWRQVVLTLLSPQRENHYTLVFLGRRFLSSVMLNDLGIDTDKVQKAVQEASTELVTAGPSGQEEEKESTLAECSKDLTQMAREGKLDPVAGRDPEIMHALQILARRQKNNPVLVGDPGVGKTAIAEGLAQLLVDAEQGGAAANKIPKRLRGKRVMSLEIGQLISGTKYRGEFEKRLNGIMKELRGRNDTIIFIDELHTMVGAGSTEGGMDAGNLLKPALARGELHVMGATTISEYRQYIEKDPALERRFQPVTIDEPSIEVCTQILNAVSKRYSDFHEVDYKPEALEAAVKLSARYLPDRFLPDKAIDLMDEAAVIAQTDMEAVNGAGRPQVEIEHIAAAISRWSGIPVAKLTADEAKAMLDVESVLHQRVIGQSNAVSAIARALRRARAGLKSAGRPVASMLFCGPTGVGKTELVKAVAETYYGDESAMVRLDMSEYMQEIAVSRLTGPPPGYVGYEEGGQLTNAVRRNPHTVVLFDEVEKAHPDVFNVLLQILDDGRLTDNKGRVVDFSNTMILLTSNVGSQQALSIAQKPQGVGEEHDADKEYALMRAAVKAELGRSFRPEFLNRLDEVVVFESLKLNEVSQVATLFLDDFIQTCRENDIKLSTTPRMSEALAEAGYSATYGARPLRRAMQRMCEDAVAEAMLAGFVNAGENLEMDYHDGEVILTNQAGATHMHAPMLGGGIEEDAGFTPEPDIIVEDQLLMIMQQNQILQQKLVELRGDQVTGDVAAEPNPQPELCADCEAHLRVSASR